MLYADAIRRQVEDAPRAALPAVTAALWRAFAEGHVTEAEAEALSALIEARQTKTANLADLCSPVSGTSMPTDPASPADRQNSLRTGVGSRPVSGASLERRRRWASSGRIPPAIAARFSLGEQAALALVAAETARKGDCRLSVPHLAAVAGVAETTVRNAIREAKKLGLLTVEERRVTGYRNDTNVVRIVSPEWTAWLRLARKGVANRYPLGQHGVANHHPTRRDGVTDRYPTAQKGAPSRYPLGRKGVTDRYPPAEKGVANHHPHPRGGCKFANRTPTQVLKQGKARA